MRLGFDQPPMDRRTHSSMPPGSVRTIVQMDHDHPQQRHATQDVERLDTRGVRQRLCRPHRTGHPEHAIAKRLQGVVNPSS